MDEITIVLPVPNKILHPNGGQLWGNKFEAKRKARWDGKMAALAAKNASKIDTFPWKHVQATATFYLLAKRRRDKDNLRSWIKNYWDGIQDAGIIKNDYFLRMDREPEVVVVKSDHRVELTLERVCEISGSQA